MNIINILVYYYYISTILDNITYLFYTLNLLITIGERSKPQINDKFSNVNQFLQN